MQLIAETKLSDEQSRMIAALTNFAAKWLTCAAMRGIER